MKCWLMVFVVAVWLQLPSEGDAKQLAPALREISTNKLAHVAKRHKLAHEKRGASSEEMNREIAELLESDEVEALLAEKGLSMSMINEMVDNDDEIEPEDRDIMKMLIIMSLAGIDLDELDFDDRAIFKRKL